MDLDFPEINPSELTAEVRKSMARHVFKSHVRSTTSAPDLATSAPSTPLENDRSSPDPGLSAELRLAPDNSQLSSLPGLPKLESQPVFEANANDQYDLNDLLKFHDVAFLNAAYRAVLKREPDSFGYNSYLEQLREGHLDRVDLLSILRFSSEGKLKNVQVTGLALPAFMRRLGRLPLIGYPIRLAMDVFRLPVLIQRTRQHEAYAASQNRRVAEYADELAQYAKGIAEHTNRLAEHTHGLNDRTNAIADNTSELGLDVNRLNDSLTAYATKSSTAMTDLSRRFELEAERHRQIRQQFAALAQQQQKYEVNLRRELRDQLTEERTRAQEQTQQLIQEQSSRFESADNETRAQIAELESATGDRMSQIESSGLARIAELESATSDRMSQIESSGRARIAELESATGDRMSQLESSGRAQIAELESATGDRMIQIESLAQLRVTELESAVRAWIAELEISARAATAELESSFDGKIASLASSTNDINTKLTEAECATSNLQGRISSVESSSIDLRAAADKLESRSQALQVDIAKIYQQLQHARGELALQSSRMSLILEEARMRLLAASDQQQLEIIATAEQHDRDALYAELEDNFRGSYEEIKERFRVYLPHIKALEITDDLPIVDLGCGRGEWLELLKEEGYGASGVDTNQVLIERCRARSLEVIESDALRYLRGLPDNSVRAVTGFHIIEHLQIEVLMNLLDESLRVLHPGGIAIFETPNPENVLVGSNFFYFDPTHRNPLPSLLMKFLLESRGLNRVEVLNLHPWDQACLGGNSELTARFNELFYGPMDYAIAGWKGLE